MARVNFVVASIFRERKDGTKTGRQGESGRVVPPSFTTVTKRQLITFTQI